MTFDWRTPFEIAFEFTLFAIGWTLVIFVASLAIIATVSIVRGLISALRKSKSIR
jgi:ABC-type dipeptide/oligopeptide/nickel transport system permease component